MGIGTRLSALAGRARHASGVVPRLWAAASAAGLDPRDAVTVLRVSEASLRTATTHGRGVPGRTNALRHFSWQALLAAKFGAAAASSIADAQESGSPAARDSQVDQHNNEVGRAWGEAHGAEVRDLPIADAMARLIPVGLEKWDAGELVWVQRH